MAHTYTVDELYNSAIYDSNGDKVGDVGQVYVNDTTGEPDWVTVRTGFFGMNESFVPLRGANKDADGIRVPYTKDFIKDAPNVESDAHFEDSEQDRLYSYYSNDKGFTDREDEYYAGRGDAAGLGAAGTYDRDADVDRDRDIDLDRDRGADLDRDRGVEGDSVVRHEEEVRVGTERVERGRVRLRKHVVTEQQDVSVPVQREEVEVVREPITDGERGGTIEDGEVEVTLHEERPVIEKEVVAKERVGLDKNVVEEERHVTTDVRREEVEVDQDVDRDVDTDFDGDRRV